MLIQVLLLLLLTVVLAMMLVHQGGGLCLGQAMRGQGGHVIIGITGGHSHVAGW